MPAKFWLKISEESGPIERKSRGWKDNIKIDFMEICLESVD